jgi:hypothetical protein
MDAILSRKSIAGICGREAGQQRRRGAADERENTG